MLLGHNMLPFSMVPFICGIDSKYSGYWIVMRSVWNKQMMHEGECKKLNTGDLNCLIMVYSLGHK